ncbi:DUF5719 family protein [Rarobacter faecitabidus]|uniref:Large extracellular alpha-helical protein n=1 Tax=Rarobacter faecitabidus TaxID=13243 RepID=A0A542ZU74_RARFA|nr:DUF5719 family protein [Rarobacter faecitabidus]TQL63908.1 hypothetical protein FB461_0387 [Rarobacter faecitabidus]
MSRIGQIASSVAVLALAGGALLIPSVAGPAALPGDSGNVGASDVRVTPAQVVLSCPAPLTEAIQDESAEPSSDDPSSAQQSFTLTESRADALTEASAIDARGQEANAAAPRASLRGSDPIAVVAQVAAPAWPSATTIIGAVPDASPGAPGARPAGAIAQWTPSGDLRGLTAGTCVPPSPDQWIVAGSTEPGNASEVVINNPGLTAVTATVSVYGSILATEGENTDVIAIAPGATQVVPLGALVPAESRIVVHVETDGGYVTASVAQNSLDGLVPIGIDLAPAGDGPGNVQVLPGVAVDGSAIGDERGALLRLLATDGDANASVRLVTASGVQPLRGAQEVPLTRGQVTDVSLGDVPAGEYAIVVAADGPVVAGAKSVRRGGTISSTEGSLSVDVGTSGDFAWVQSRRGDQDDGRIVIPVPSQVSGTLTIVRSPADGEALLAAIARVPIVGDTAPESAPATTSARITAYDAAGTELTTRQLELDLLSPAAIDLASLGPAGSVAAITIDVPAAAGERFDVALVAGAPQVEGSIAVLQPVSSAVEPVTIPVVRGPLG